MHHEKILSTYISRIFSQPLIYVREYIKETQISLIKKDDIKHLHIVLFDFITIPIHTALKLFQFY